MTGRRMPTAPMQQEEVKDHPVNCQSSDEAIAITYLGSGIEEQSVSSTICKEWDLDRAVITDCHNAMARDRVLQTTFNNLAGAAC